MWIRRHLPKIIIGLLVSAPICAYVAWQSYKAGIHNFYLYAGYANAINDYLEDHATLPPALQALEQAYNANPGHTAQVPPPAGHPRPRYRPPSETVRGEQLVVVGGPSPWYCPFRTVVYLDYTKRVARANLVLKRNIAGLIRKDDALRSEAASRPSP